jgi:hypothetical protein
MLGDPTFLDVQNGYLYLLDGLKTVLGHAWPSKETSQWRMSAKNTPGGYVALLYALAERAYESCPQPRPPPPALPKPPLVIIAHASRDRTAGGLSCRTPHLSPSALIQFLLP